MKSSIYQFFRASFSALKRFPLVCLSALLGSTALSMMLGDGISDERQAILANWAQTFSLGIPLFFALQLYSESLKSQIQKWLIFNSSLVLLYAIHLHLNYAAQGLHQGELTIQYVGYFLALHLLVSFLPISGRFNSSVFWHYNKTLFLRAAITALYVGVLFAGLAGAMVALDQLLGFDIEDIYYGRLWFYLAGFGSVWMFTAHIPQKLEETMDTGYPKGLQVFAQYVLMPLVLIYLVILYIYGFKIAINGVLPIGWVSNLILAFSVVGMLALLLLHPLSENHENKWVNRFTRGFYISLLPLLVLLYIAAFTRINTYGFTELRYALLALSIWLTGITIFMIVTKNKYIWVIPVTLFFTVVFVFFMPKLNLFSISKESQKQRLHSLLKSNKMLSNQDKLLAPLTSLPDSISSEMYSISDYLAVNHGITGLEPVLVIPDSIMAKNSRWEMEVWLDQSLAPYGISREYENTVFAEDAVQAATNQNGLDSNAKASINYPNLKIRFRGPVPNRVNIPRGNWSQCADVEIKNFNYTAFNDANLRINKDVTGKNLYVSTKKYSDVFNLDSLMAKHVYAYKKPQNNVGNGYFFPDSKNVIVLQQPEMALQIFYMNYKWNRQTKEYELDELTAKLWLR